MKRKYLSALSIAALALAFVGLLSGCGNQTADDAVGTVQETPLPVQETPQQEAAPAPASTTPAISDADLDQVIKDTDADLESIKTSGFEAGNLTDKDLGL